MTFEMLIRGRCVEGSGSVSAAQIRRVTANLFSGEDPRGDHILDAPDTRSISLDWLNDVPRPEAFRRPSLSIAMIDGSSMPFRTCDGENEEVMLGWEEGGARLSIREDVIGVSGWGRRAKSSAALELALSEALRIRGLVRFHAAASEIVGGWLFLAPSGTGKTTTALQALRRGHPLLGQDLVWFDSETGSLSRADRGLHVTRETRAQIDDLFEDVEWLETRRKKFYAPYDRLGIASAEAPLTTVVLLRRADAFGEGSEWTSLPRSEAAMALWSAATLPLTRAGRRATAKIIQEIAMNSKRLRLDLAGPVDFASVVASLEEA